MAPKRRGTKRKAETAKEKYEQRKAETKWYCGCPFEACEAMPASYITHAARMTCFDCDQRTGHHYDEYRRDKQRDVLATDIRTLITIIIDNYIPIKSIANIIASYYPTAPTSSK